MAMANIALQSGRITDPDQMIAAALAMKAAKATLEIMQEGQICTVLDVKPKAAPTPQPAESKAKKVKMPSEASEAKAE